MFVDAKGKVAHVAFLRTGKSEVTPLTELPVLKNEIKWDA